MHRSSVFLRSTLLVLLSFALPVTSWLRGVDTAGSVRKILFIAGRPSHGPGEHRFPAGCQILVEALNQSGLPLKAELSVDWPASDAALEEPTLVVLYSDGLASHVAKGKAAVLEKRLKKGLSLAVLHFALEAPEDDPELKRVLLASIGARFETFWSVNPTWMLKAAPERAHPASRGVWLLEGKDEWYYHMRFRESRVGIQPLLQTVPPESSLGNDGPRSGNRALREALARQEPQLLAWTCLNENGARGFGFTGGHAHRYWYEPSFRKLVLNALVWTAGLEVPASGVESKAPTLPLYATIDEAIARGDLDDVARHLAADPSLARRPLGAKSPPLHQAILRKKNAIALLLLEKGADVNQPDTDKRSLLHLAVERGSLEVLVKLLQLKADPNTLDQSGWTPLHHAAAKNQLALVKALLEGGANPNRLSERGGTALHEAAVGASAELAQLLLAHGVDVSVRSLNGVTALDIAREYKNAALIKLLTK